LKRSFSLLELLVLISLIAIATSFLIPKKIDNSLELAADRIILYLKYTRYIASIDNKFERDDEMWFRKRWTLKFQNCKNKSGIYFVVFSDENKKGMPNKDECLKDPVNEKYLYSNSDCEASDDESPCVLLTKEFGVTDVQISCNKTSTRGQISFGSDGNIYSKLGTKKSDVYKNEIDSVCESIKSINDLSLPCSKAISLSNGSSLSLSYLKLGYPLYSQIHFCFFIDTF
jgi:hypothetical protein